MKALATTVLGILSVCAIPAWANLIPITYSLTGGPIAPPVVSGTTLILDGYFTGSIVSGDTSLDTGWNPVTYQDHSIVDLTTGLLHGTISILFANGDTLAGNVFEDVSELVATGGGSFTQTLTFTGGSGMFAGATGSVSGSGVAGGTVSGSGVLNAPAIPEPGSIGLLLGGFAVLGVSGRLKVNSRFWQRE